MEYESVAGKVLLEMNERRAASVDDLIRALGADDPEREAQVVETVQLLLPKGPLTMGRWFQIEATFPQIPLSTEMGSLMVGAAIVRRMQDGKERTAVGLADELSELTKNKALVFDACKRLLGTREITISPSLKLMLPTQSEVRVRADEGRR